MKDGDDLASEVPALTSVPLIGVAVNAALVLPTVATMATKIPAGAPAIRQRLSPSVSRCTVLSSRRDGRVRRSRILA